MAICWWAFLRLWTNLTFLGDTIQVERYPPLTISRDLDTWAYYLKNMHVVITSLDDAFGPTPTFAISLIPQIPNAILYQHKNFTMVSSRYSSIFVAFDTLVCFQIIWIVLKQVMGRIDGDGNLEINDNILHALRLQVRRPDNDLDEEFDDDIQEFDEEDAVEEMSISEDEDDFEFWKFYLITLTNRLQ